MTARGLLHVLLAVLALATLATPAQANPSCIGTILCASEEPCVDSLCLPETAIPQRNCMFAACIPQAPFTFCDRAACLSSPSHCDTITFGEIDEWSIDTSCLLPRWPPMPMQSGSPTWVFDLVPDLP